MPQTNENPMHDLGQLNTATIRIQNHRYVPEMISVKEGAVIKVVNNDPDEHTITAQNDEFDEEVGAGNETELITQGRGEYNYYCRYHPNMKGKLIVK